MGGRAGWSQILIDFKTKLQIFYSTMMMSSRLTNLVTRVFGRGLLLQGRYGMASDRKTTAIHYKIFETNNWQNFMSLFQQEKAEFTPDVIAATTKHIISLLSKNRGTDHQDITKIIQTLESIEIDTLSATSIINLLSLIRSFMYRGYGMGNHWAIKTKLCNRYLQSLKDRQPGTEDLADLLFGYFQMVYFKQMLACQLISQRLNFLISKDFTNRNIFTITQMGYLIHVLSNKGDLSSIEVRIRTHILTCISEKKETVKMRELVTLFVDIGRMDTIDMVSNDYHNIKTIGTRILQNLGELDERSIFDLLKGDHYQPHHIFSQISKELVQNIYAEISDEGVTHIDNVSLLKMISQISNRIPFSHYSESQKNKYLQFLTNYAKNQLKGVESYKKLEFLNTLTHLINNRYWEVSKKNELISLVQSVDVIPQLGIIEALYGLKLDVSSFFIDMMSNSLEQMSPIRILKIALFTNTLAKDANYQQIKEKLEIYSHTINTKVAHIFETPQKFIGFMRQFGKGKGKEVLDLRAVDRLCRQLFEKLPNPFQEDFISVNYVNSYMTYVFGTHNSKQIQEFLNANQQGFSNKNLSQFIINHLDKDPRDIEPSQGLLNAINLKLQKIFEQKDKLLISRIIDVISKYNRAVVLGSFRSGSIYRIIHRFLNEHAVLDEVKENNKFETALLKYFTRSHRNYTIESDYRKLLIHGLSKIQNMNFNQIVEAMIKEGLKLGMLNEKTAKSVDVSKIKLPFIVKAQLEWLRDNSYTPEINNINPRTLPLIFSNPNLEPLVIERSKEIIDILGKMYPRQICECIVSWRLSYKGQAATIFGILLEKLTESKNGYDRCDIYGVIEHLLRNNVYYYRQTKDLTERIIEFAQSHIASNSIDTHIKFLQLIGSQSGLNPQEYVQELGNYARSNAFITEYDELMGSLALTNYKFTPQDLSRLPIIMTKETNQALRIFLHNEDNCSPQIKKEVLSALLSITKEKSNVLTELHLDYLKRHYPEELKDLVVLPEQLHNPKYVIKARPASLGLLQQIAKTNGIEGQLEVNLPDSNIGYRLGDKLVVFLTQRHMGAFYEHGFIKKALKEHFQAQNINLQVIAIGVSSPSNFLNYLAKSAPEMISQDLMDKLQLSLKKSNKDQEE